MADCFVETVQGPGELVRGRGLEAHFYGVERMADGKLGYTGEDAGDEAFVGGEG